MIRAVLRVIGAVRSASRLNLLPVRDRLYVHLVWTTRNREATIDVGVARFLERFLPAVARQERAGVHALGMVQTHVHLLLQLHPTTSIPRLLQRLKGGSSVLANREGHATQRPLRWAKGYSIASVSPRALEAVRAYVLSQPSHHRSEVIPGWQAAAVAPGTVGPWAPPFAAESRDSAERSRAATPQMVTLGDR